MFFIKPKSQFTTGEFARLCGVTKHTLFHYDALGVLSPALRGENGYRYYAAQQIEVFHVIAVLRELDMPLAAIRAYLDRRSPAEFVSLLEREDAALTQRLSRLRRLRDLVREKAELTRAAAAMDYALIVREEQPRTWLLRTEVEHATDGAAASLAVAEHVRQRDRRGVLSPYPIGAMLDLDCVRRGDFEHGYTHFYTRVEERTRGLALYERAAGTYLCACHTGGYHTVEQTYARMLGYAQEEGLELCGPFFEDVLLDELSAEGYENYVLRMSVRLAVQEK